jgi:hypothetical protein
VEYISVVAYKSCFVLPLFLFTCVSSTIMVIVDW